MAANTKSAVDFDEIIQAGMIIIEGPRRARSGCLLTGMQTVNGERMRLLPSRSLVKVAAPAPLAQEWATASLALDLP